MKRLSSRFLIILFLLLPPSAQAAELAPIGTWERKFQRGLLNVAFAPLEIVHALTRKEIKQDEFPSSVTMGIGKGSYFACLRALTGIFEIVTFPLPIPPHYAPLIQPEFSLGYLDDPGEEKAA